MALMERDAAREELARQYGKIEPTEFIKRSAEAEKPVDLEETLREDYELGLLNGQFYMSYRAACNACKFEFRYRHEEAVKI
ncbi:MAG: hypothetical protein KGL39_47655 [Patescibacteria group bacterium]|nr:hypothetical protein [Patescibacteria group bacterium]